MNLSAPFINRPIATTLLALGIAIAGIVAFYLLPVSALPQIDFPTISVQASLPGASPEIMASSVATPLERQLGWIAGITQITSSSTLGSTRINVQFDLSRDINGAARDVQAAINAARSQLPINLPSNPTYRKVNPADSPIMIVALTSNIFSPGQMYDAASTILQQKISQIEGVGQVIVGGSSLPAVRVELDPTKLSHYGISLTSVADVLKKANANRPKGQLLAGKTTSEIISNDQLFKAKEYAPLIIKDSNGNVTRLSDVGYVQDSVENVYNAGTANGKPAVLLVIFKVPGANVIKTVDAVKAELPQLQKVIPAAIHLNVVLDRTSTIRAALHDVEITLIISMLLVVLVTYLFLGSLPAMYIPGVAVLLSLLGTFGVMRLFGYSLDNLSLMALTISTGFVIDDAIVMLENISRHIEEGIEPMSAALMGAKEVSFTVVSMSLSLIAVFIPILFMGGIVGRLFHEFAVTLSTAILVSLLVSLTVTPMMCARILKKNGVQTEKPKQQYIMRHLLGPYERSLHWALLHPRTMLLITLGAILLNVILYVIVPKGFFPQQDTGRITVSMVADQSISFPSMRNKFLNIVDIIKQDTNIENIVGYIGGGTMNSGTMYISLKPLSDRKLSAMQEIDVLREKVKNVSGARIYMQAAQDLVIGGRSGNAQFQYTLSANNLNDLNTWSPIVLARLLKLPGIADVNTDQLTHGLQEYIKIDRDNAARLGISVEQIDQTLYDAFGQSQVATFYTAMNQYHVVMEVSPEFRQQPQSLDKIYLITAAGTVVPLSAVAHFAPSTTLLSVNHQGQMAAATLSFNLLAGAALGDAVNTVGAAIDKLHLPSTINGAFQGTAQAFQASLANEPYLIAVALLAVYIVLGMLYESMIHPITILSTLPSAGIGALLALLITKTELSVIALIGILLLIGIVKKNAIMMIDFALDAERNKNKSARDAIQQAALLRFRPIMMTTMAAMLGALPLAIGRGEGAELRQPLGITIIGGLLISQMLTLYTTPVIYLEMEKVGQWCRRQWGFWIKPIT